MALPKLRKVGGSNPTSKKKKILLLSDDLRMHSGIGTVSREFVRGTVKDIDWIQIGGAIKHPDAGQLIDISADIAQQTGVADASVKIYPVSGYGDADLVRQLIAQEKPDAILHFTDPRFWGWLYQIEHEIRQQVPIMYYTIWDDLPLPIWNQPFYECCDWLGAISKQTYGIVKNVRDYKRPKEEGNTQSWQVDYVPHGINAKVFRPMTDTDSLWSHYNDFKKHMLDNKEYDFVLYYNNRNIRRKQTSDIILAWNDFCKELTPEQADKCLLLMHTPAVDPNGTNLYAVKEMLCPDFNIKFSQKHISESEMMFMYNLADVTINIASNEGFGLSGAESLMCGTPIINNITGGLQDHCGFKIDGKFITAEQYVEIGSLHDDKKWKNNPTLTWGEWAIPVWPSNRSIQGSPETPFIFDDRARFDEVAEKIHEWYKVPQDVRHSNGLAGRAFVTNAESMLSATEMCDGFVRGITATLKNWKPRKRFTIYKIEDK
jgi:glycosyltransferase involved in cell wall biosynthesis